MSKMLKRKIEIPLLRCTSPKNEENISIHFLSKMLLNRNLNWTELLNRNWKAKIDRSHGICQRAMPIAAEFYCVHWILFVDFDRWFDSIVFIQKLTPDLNKNITFGNCKSNVLELLKMWRKKIFTSNDCSKQRIACGDCKPAKWTILMVLPSSNHGLCKLHNSLQSESTYPIHHHRSRNSAATTRTLA